MLVPHDAKLKKQLEAEQALARTKARNSSALSASGSSLGDAASATAPAATAALAIRRGIAPELNLSAHDATRLPITPIATFQAFRDIDEQPYGQVSVRDDDDDDDERR